MSRRNKRNKPKIQNKQDSKIKREVIIQTLSFSGPIPPPAVLREYNEILPGAAERILRSAEIQSTHRQELEKIIVTGDDKRATRGQIFAGCISLVILSFSFILILFDKVLVGSIFGGGTILTLIGFFIYGKRSEGKEKNQKETELEEKVLSNSKPAGDSHTIIDGEIKS